MSAEHLDTLDRFDAEQAELESTPHPESEAALYGLYYAVPSSRRSRRGAPNTGPGRQTKKGVSGPGKQLLSGSATNRWMAKNDAKTNLTFSMDPNSYANKAISEKMTLRDAVDAKNAEISNNIANAKNQGMDALRAAYDARDQWYNAAASGNAEAHLAAGAMGNSAAETVSAPASVAGVGPNVMPSTPAGRPAAG